jgi:hypothetical protein
MANINNGTVTVQVVGGVGPYQYTLLNAGTNQPIPNNAYPTFQNPVNNIVSNTFTFGNATDNTGNSGLAPGQYKVKIVDSNLCETVSNTLFVTDITPIAPTATPVPVPTATILPTATAIIPTATPVPDPTATEVIPTATPVPDPTATEVIPTATPVPDPTATEVIPTATPVPDPTATAIPAPTATSVPVPTATPIAFDELNVISGVQVEPGSIWEQFSGQYSFTNDPTSQANVDALTCYFTGLILTDPTKFAFGNTNYIISGETLQIGTQIYTGGAPYPGVLKGIVHNSSLPTYNQNFVHSINYTYIETDANGIINYIITDTICAPAPTATPVPVPTATPVPAPTATAIPAPTATPVPAPTATAIPAPTATPVPDPTATPVPEASPTYWFHWNGNGGYPGVDSLTTPSSAYYLNDNTTTTDFDLIFVDMLANEGTANNLEQYDAAVFSAINNTIIPNGTLVFAANVASSERYYIAIPKSISTTNYVTTAKFADAANGIPFTFASKLDFTHLGNAYTLYEVFDQPIAGALTLNVV